VTAKLRSNVVAEQEALEFGALALRHDGILDRTLVNNTEQAPHTLHFTVFAFSCPAGTGSPTLIARSWPM
jgi:hypothetical protein